MNHAPRTPAFAAPLTAAPRAPSVPVRPSGLRPAGGVLQRPSSWAQLPLDLRPRQG